MTSKVGHSLATKQLFCLLSCLTAGSSALSAAPSFYTTLATFSAAAGTPATFGFNGIVTGSSSVNFSTAAGLTLNGFQFVGTNGNGGYYLGAQGPQFYFSDYNRVAASSLQGPAVTSSFYSISRKSPGFVSAGYLASMSYRSVSIHPGPKI